MTTPESGSLLSNEPVLAAHAAGAVISYVLTLLVTHGVISTTSASSLTQDLAPPVAALFLFVIGLVVRRFVTPVAKLAGINVTLPAVAVVDPLAIPPAADPAPARAAAPAAPVEEPTPAAVPAVPSV